MNLARTPPAMTEVRATARLQFHRGFTLDDALPLVDYFAELGISHLYASPLFTARPGSVHGYDVLDPTRINPELGGEAALVRLVEALHQRGMGLILDIVSNHMAVGGAGNPWWLDVLEWGEASPYAKFFDIQWRSHDPLLRGQLLVPFLRSDYGEVLAAGEIVLNLQAETGQLYVSHFDHRFPLLPASYARVLRRCDHPALGALASHFEALSKRSQARHKAKALQAQLADTLENEQALASLQNAMKSFRPDAERGFERLHALLEAQHYRLASWRTAADDINWRRFFDINELGGLRTERTEVFEAIHAKVFELVERGLLDGLRIDHVDGLANPRAYCRRLRRRIDRLCPDRHLPIYVEKILGAGERLREDWGVDGTTGYEFMNQVSLLQHDAHGERLLTAFWQDVSGRSAPFLEEVIEARQLMLSTTLAGDLETVAQGLHQVARQDIATRDLTLGAIRRALLALIMHFTVYRTYVGVCGRLGDDQQFFQQALDGARQDLPETDWPLLEHLDRWLGGQPLRGQPPGAARKGRRKVLTRFQQLTAPAAAKAVEDTACYRSAVLLSRNDVGFDPENFSVPLSAFNAACAERAERFPANLLATATHDHKRGEDNRARLAVISERAEWYTERARHWLQLAEPLRTQTEALIAPVPADELMLYQTLLGSWPLQLDEDDTAALQAYLQRLLGWQEKALREAKLHSSWSAPNQAYEGACREFLTRLLTDAAGVPLRREIAAAANSLAPAGALNGLAQCLLRLTTPGVPDLYQGCEFWDFSLVDPDNRQPVDFAARQAALSAAEDLPVLVKAWRDGRIKQRLIQEVLRFRQAHDALFRHGAYQPLRISGDQADQVMAFARVWRNTWVIVVVPLHAAGLLGDRQVPHIDPLRWGDTQIHLPAELAATELVSLLTPARLMPQQGCLAAQHILADFSLNLLHALETAS